MLKEFDKFGINIIFLIRNKLYIFLINSFFSFLFFLIDICDKYIIKISIL